MEPEIQILFDEAVKLFHEGDLRTALRFFRAYLTRSGRRQAEAYAYLKLIGDLALDAGRASSGRGNLRQAADNLTLAMSAEGPAKKVAAEHQKTVSTQLTPKLPEFKSALPPPDPARPSLWRRPHMEFSHSLPLGPDTTFYVEVYADESDPLPGEMIDAIELPDRPQSSYELEVRLLASAHFRLSSALVQPLLIERMKSRTANVRFTITVVSAETLQKVEKKPASVCAEFFYEGRPVGKVMRNVELVGITPFPKPKSLEGLPKARTTIAIDPGTVAADLVVTVTSQLENDNRHFWCTVMTRLLPEYTRGITDEWITAEVTSAVVGNFMRDFTKAGLNKIERLAKLRGAGKDLYKASPDIFKEVFWKLIDSNASLKSIAIVSDEPFVPWELMIPYRKSEEGAPPDVRDPLGVEFLVGRMTRRSHVAGAQRVPLRDSYVVAPVFEGPRSLPHAQKEADFVTSLFPGARIDPANFESLNVKLDPCRSLLHFACHGEVTSQGQQILYLDDEKEFSAVDLNGLPGPERGIPIARPLVFLNACQVGRPVPGLVGVNGFAATFTEMGAQAVVAPLWSVKDTIAHEIALNFYTIAKKDKSVPFAEILRQQRAKAYDPEIAEDTYAAYCFYGDPLAVPV